jgi:hypothetical protein
MNYTDTYTSEIFQKSNCLSHEKKFYDTISDWLLKLGYHATHPHVYQRDQRRVILAIVDDPQHVNYGGSEDFYSDLSFNDIVITDSAILRPVLARVIGLPTSWFGIYAYEPEVHRFLPDRLFSLAINRIDFNRTLLLLRMQMLGRLDQGYVNFNCSDHSTQTTTQKRDLWDHYSAQVNQWHQNKYQRSSMTLRDQMPLRNHDLDHDVAGQAGAINIIVETYSSDFSISVSEKIFRALVTPRPWTVLAAPWTVCHLEKLGFDVMRDLVDHRSYDGLHMRDDKIAAFERVNHAMTSSFRQHNNSIDQSWYQINILPRAQAAANHNVNVLKSLRTSWEIDQLYWFNEVLIPQLK